MSDAFKSAVEQVEPGVHQYLPVEYVDKSGKHMADRWFMIVCNRIDSTDHEATEATGLALYLGRIWTPARELPDANPADWVEVPRTEKLIFSEAKASGRHIWFDKFSNNGPFVSDALAQALIEKKLKGVALTKGESISLP